MTWNNVGAGSYSVTARACDRGSYPTGNATVQCTTSAPAAITVNAPNQAPTVSLASPANGTVYPQAPASITVTATASDPDGSIGRVEFYRNSEPNPFATLTLPPYSATIAGAAAGSYSFTAKAYDNLGAVATSAPVNARVNANPAATLTAPSAGGAVVNLGQSYQLRANAGDTDGSIARVEFFNGSTSIGQAAWTGSDFALTWTPPTGTFSVRARATDNDGATADSTVAQLKVNTLPAGSIGAPAAGTVYVWPPASVAVSVSASDTDGGVNRVEIYNDGAYRGNATLSSGTAGSGIYSYSISGLAGRSAPYSISARVVDSDGAATNLSAVSITVNQLPTGVTVAASPTSAVAPATFSLSATASDPDPGGSIAKVEYYRSGVLIGTATSAPFTVTWGSVATGSYSVLARAYDNRGGWTESSPVTLNSGTPPTVSLTSPANNAQIAQGVGINLTASAADSDGSVSAVNFYDNGALIGAGTLSNGLYRYTWSGATAGTHLITARATDNQTLVTTSAPATIEVVAAQMITPPNLSGGTSGSIAGVADIAMTGAATYSIPLRLPPGTAGMVPSLALEYSSDAARGLLGVGWRLTGFSSITRCAQTVAQDGVRRAVTLAPEDRFCLDGQRLVLVTVGGTYGAAGTEYRTELDTFSRIVANGGTTVNGPDSWTVYTKSGQIVSYGTTADSRVEAQGRAVVLTWAASKVEDRRGNFYSFSYFESNADGGFWPTTIRYSGKNGTTNNGYHKVTFDYVDREDPILNYVAGSKLTVSKRLAAVKAFINTAGDGSGGSLVREYRLAYSRNSVSGFNRIDNVRECDAAGLCLPPTSFVYSSRTAANNTLFATGSGNWGGPAATIATTCTPSPCPSADQQVVSQILMGDFDGDGQTDLLSSSGNGAWSMCRSTGTSFNCQSWTGPSLASKYFVTGDFNGDGRTDIAASIPGLPGYQVCLSNGSSSFDCSNWGGTPLTLTTQKGIVADFTGDGRDDLVVHGAASGLGVRSYLCRSTGSAFNCAQIPTIEDIVNFFANEGPRPQWRLGDVNGDGRADFITSGVWLASDAGFGNTSLLSPNFVSGVKSSTAQRPRAGASMFGDLTGNPYGSYADIAVRNQEPDGVTTSFQVCRSTGVSYDCQSLPGIPNEPNLATLGSSWLNDLDGDGKPDTISGGSSIAGVCQISAGPTLSTSCTPWTVDSDATTPTVTVWGDFNGDGKLDSASYYQATGQWRVRLTGVAQPPDQLVRVTNGFGHTTEFAYKSLRDPTVYARDSGAVYPQRDVTEGAQWVVSQLRVDNGVGSTMNADYSYGGLKVDLAGRGSLGFRWVQVFDAVTQVTTRTEYSQSWPTLGQVMSIRATHASSVVLRDVTNSLATRTTFGATTPPVQFSYVRARTETTRDLNNALIATTTSEAEPAGITPNGYDDYGNALALRLTTVADGDTYTSVMRNSYNNLTTEWLIGQLAQTATTRTGPGVDGLSESVTREARTDYFATYGDVQRVTLQPNDATLREKLTTEYARDSFGNVSSKTLFWREPAVSLDPSAGTDRSRVVEAVTAFDSKGRWPLTVVNALSHSETRAYNDAFGDLTSLTGPNGLTTSWTYDTFGRRTVESRADGTSTRWDYKACVDACSGAVTVLIRQERAGSAMHSVPTETFMDRLARTVQTRTWGFDGTAILSQQQFDVRGRLQRSARPYFSGASSIAWTNYEYDDLGRRTRILEPRDGGATAESRITYNGVATTYRNARNFTKTERMNGLGKLKEVVDAVGKSTRYVYDPFGNLRQTIDAKGNKVTIAYDGLGRRRALSDPDLGGWSYEVDPLGQGLQRTDAKGQTTRFRYDALGRIVRRLAPDQDANWIFDTAAKGIGKLREAYTLIGAGPAKDYRRVLSYDNLSRLSATTITLDGDYVSTVSYDSFGRPASVDHGRRTIGGTTGPGTTVEYGYNTRGYLSQIRAAASTGGVSRVEWRVVAQDAEQRVRSVELGNGLRTVRDYSAASGWLGAIRTGLPSGADTDSSVQNDVYQYDSIGNLNLRVLAGAGGALYSESFTYDALNRVGTSTIGTTTKTFGYDELGNLTSKSGIGTLVYPAAGSSRPHAPTSIVGTVLGASNPSLFYDANGNHTTMTAGGTTIRSITWTSFNAPLTITRGGASSSFTYGPEQQRTRQTQAGPALTIYYAGAIEKEVSASTTRIKTYLPRGVGYLEEVINSGSAGPTASASPQRRYFHTDHQGSTLGITNEARSLERLSYDVWGKRRNADGTDGSDTLTSTNDRHGYTGHEHLDALSLVHMNGRVYDPLLARFVSPDPLVADPDNPQNLNRYSYVLNNPLGYTDPSGFVQLGVNRNVEQGGQGIGPSFDGATESLPPVTVEGKAIPGCRGACVAAVVGQLAAIQRQQMMAGLQRLRPAAERGLRTLMLTLRLSVGEIVGSGLYLLAMPSNGWSDDGSRPGELSAATLALISQNVAASEAGADQGSDNSEEGKSCPNPDGCKGKQDHQDKVDELERKAQSEAGPNERVVRERKVQGHDSNRRPDVQIVDENGRARQIYEAERRPESKRNRDREAEYDRLRIPNQTFPLK